MKNLEHGSLMNWWLVIAVELALCAFGALLLRRVARKYTRRGLTWWAVCLAGFACAGFPGPYITLPSTAPRVSVTGRARDCRRHVIGRGQYTYSFQFEPLTGAPFYVSTHIDAPLCWGGPRGEFDGRVYKITYLNDPTRSLRNEAISIGVIAGQNTGWHRSVDARVFGLWLMVPTGFGLIVLGGIGALRNCRAKAPEERHAVAGAPLKDDESGLTDLKL